MRTTLTLDDDVAAQIEQLRRSENVSLRDVVNDALRLGLKELGSARKPTKPFRSKTFDLGPSKIPNIDNIAEVLAIGEGEAFK